MSFWELQCDARFGEGVRRPLDELGIEAAEARFVSRQPDTVTLRAAQDLDAAELLEWKDFCVLWRDGARYFAGNVTRTPRAASGESETGEFVISGPWWWMQQVSAKVAWQARPATRASREIAAGLETLTVEAAERGAAGNDITIELRDPAAAGAAIAVAVAGEAITVSLATDAGGAVISTLGEVAAALAADAAAAALVTAEATAPGAETAPVTGALGLAGGSDEARIDRPKWVHEPEDESGATLTGSHLANVITAMIADGVPIQQGQVFQGFQTLRYETAGGTWADALEGPLSLHPDAVVEFNYSTTPTTMHVRLRRDLEVETVAVGSVESPETLNFAARHDLRPDRIRVVNYAADITELLDGSVLEEDTWDLIENPQPPVRELLLDFGRGGIPQPTPGSIAATWLAQRVRARTIPQSADDAQAKDWWVDHIEFLAEHKGLLDLAELRIAAADVLQGLGAERETAVRGHKVEVADDGIPNPDPINPNAVPAPGAGPEDYPRELIDGQIEDWMGVRTAPVRVSASVGYRTETLLAIADPAVRQEFLRAFPLEWEVGGVWYSYQNFSVRVTGTNATTRVYRAPASVTFTPPSKTPGSNTLVQMQLAKAFADGLKELHFSGSFSIVDDEAGARKWIGRAVNVTGGLSAWATMRALVQEVAVDLIDGRDTVTVGAPEQAQFTRLDELEAELPETTTAEYDYAQDDSTQASAVGAFATPLNAGGSGGGGQRFLSGPAQLSIAHAKWNGATPRVIFAAALMGEINPDFVGTHPIALGAGTLDGETGVDLTLGATADFWLTWDTNEKGRITGAVSLVQGEPTGGAQYFGPGQTGSFKLLVYRVRVPAEVGGVWGFEPRAAVPVWQAYQGEAAHPWKVATNGDDTVAVAAGVVGWWVGTVTGGVTGPPYHHAYQKFAATAGITVPAGGGYIVVGYRFTAQDRGETTTTNGGNVSMHAYGKATSTGSVKFSADPSAETDDIVIVIAEVSLDGESKAVVDHQVLTHNPIVEIGELENTA